MYMDFGEALAGADESAKNLELVLKGAASAAPRPFPSSMSS